MPIFAKRGGTYKPAPAGTHAAVCCDVVDLGEIKVEYKGVAKSQHKIKIVWQIDELRDDGKRHLLRKQYTLSLHEKASLRKDLEGWRGKPFTDQESEAFDVETLLAKPALLNVIHKDANGNTYANVAGIMRLPKGMVGPTVADYVRECDRKLEDQQQAAPDWDDSRPITDDDVPF